MLFAKKMNILHLLLGITACVILSGCDTDDSNTRVAEVSSKNVVLIHGMHLNDVRKILAGVGATEVEGTYPLFWFGEGDSPGGTHTYYHLADKTCLQLRIADTEPEKTVVAFGVAPRGKSYRVS